jgi:hypothetical protein
MPRRNTDPSHRRPTGTVRITSEHRRKFLETLAMTASVAIAARASGIYVMKWYRLRKSDSKFAAAWEEALDLGVRGIEDEVVRRAVHGNATPVFFHGKQVATVRKYSDHLLGLLYRRHVLDRTQAKESATAVDAVTALLREIGEIVETGRDADGDGRGD